jgi:hypothetical protein
MKKLTVLFAGLFLMTIAVQNVNAQTSATEADVPASALIISPIAITLTNDGLEFGTLVPSGTDGTVTVPPTGARSGVDVGFISQEDEYASAAFNVTGEANYTFSITLPANINLTNGAETMVVEDFTASLPLTGNAIASVGTPFTVGATLNVGGSQAAGTYTGEFDVTVDYE